MGYDEFVGICKIRGYHHFFQFNESYDEYLKEMSIALECNDCGAIFKATGNWVNPRKSKI